MQDEVKRLLELRERLKKRIEELEAELSMLKEAEQAIDSQIKSKSITPANQLQQPQPAPQEKPRQAAGVDLRSRSGEKIGEVESGEGVITVRPLKPLDPESKPTKFLLRKLEEYKKGDDDLIQERKLSEGDAFDYQVEKGDDGYITSITIKNYRTNARRQEVMNIIRWTIERNLERGGD